LIGNAIKFTEKGEVRLDVRMTASESGICRIRFAVSDTGQGIPEMKIDRVFDSFEQAEEDHKRRSEGTGLGLAIVKQLVELQGGTINVHSKVGIGSEFVFELDFDLVEEAVIEQPSAIRTNETHEALTNMRILVVEDNKVNQLLVKSMLRQFGCTTIEAVDGGKSAIKLLESAEFDLVLMDIQMPEMDGYEVTDLIRTRLPEAKRRIPVIALTADASEKEKEKAKRAGMDDYVVKPYTPEELVAAITRQVPGKDNMTETAAVRLQHERQEVLIKMEVLDKFTGGDQQMNRELMEVFLKQVPESCSRLEHGVKEQDWNAVFMAAHKIKSSLSVFGLNDLRRIAQRMEDNAREMKHLDEIPGLMNSFLTKARTAITALEKELAEQKVSVRPRNQ
ncbi:MAG: response regulator, partial [Bacteroidota bacterium]